MSGFRGAADRSVGAFTRPNPRANSAVQRPGALDVSTHFKLIIEDDEGRTTVYPLIEGEVSIGRRDGNSIRLLERNVSRRHARLLLEDGTVFLEDLDSYNGVRINGERIASRFRVREGDLIEIGDYHLALRRDDPVASADTETIGLEDTHDSHEGEPGWPGGTLPDFRLPDDLLDDERLPTALGTPVGPRDTVLDEPAPDLGRRAEQQPEPITRPPPRSGSALPPFPANGTTPPEGPLEVRPRRAEALVGDPLDDQPTRQLNRGPALQSDVPRLVCVSTQYAGLEFPLDREELVIGRVEENDIVIEHRSVSRNHAKIRFDGRTRTHRIIDLQSANGILVNGEEYVMTNLRSGDLIELGNVRFRFVPAGERFEANQEEAREMLQNGFEAPSGASREPGGPSFDPSTAATVTDAPRSALPPARAPVVSDLERPRSDSRSSTVTDGDRDAVVTRLEPAEPVPSVVFDGTTAPRGPPWTMLGLVALLLVLVGTLAAVYLGRGDPALDARLQELFNQRNYAEAVRFFEAHEGGFARPVDAAKLAGRAEEKMQRSDDTDSEPVPTDSPEPPEAPPSAEELEPESQAPESPPERPAARRRAAASARRAAREAELAVLEREGKQAVFDGAYRTAVQRLQRCVQLVPGRVECQRLLGQAYFKQGRFEAADRHYRRFLELAPDHPSAASVREELRGIEAEARR